MLLVFAYLLLRVTASPHPRGERTGWFPPLYGIGRFFIEMLRWYENEMILDVVAAVYDFAIAFCGRWRFGRCADRLGQESRHTSGDGSGPGAAVSLFVTFEGLDGSGKTTQVQRTAKWLAEQGYDVLVKREPGGTELGEAIRDILLDHRWSGMTPRAEFLLYRRPAPSWSKR